MVDWDAGFEATPLGSESPANGDNRIRDLKTATRERIVQEHVMDLTDATAAKQGQHKPGSAKMYSQAAAPTTRPNGTTALTADDNGRLWHNTDTDEVSVYEHPDWKVINSSADITAHEAVTDAHSAVSAATPERIILRDAAGRASVVDPDAATDIATKNYVDTHAALTNPHGATSSGTANRLMLRDAAGRAQVADPSAAADIATKGYADAMRWSGSQTTFPVGTTLLARSGAALTPGTVHTVRYQGGEYLIGAGVGTLTGTWYCAGCVDCGLFVFVTLMTRTA